MRLTCANDLLGITARLGDVVLVGDDHLCTREHHAERRAELVRHAGGQRPDGHQSIRVVELLEVGHAPRRLDGGLGALRGVHRVDVLELACQLFELLPGGVWGFIARIRAQT